jgi:glycosyltransferase involved in cell wall biosynthesis
MRLYHDVDQYKKEVIITIHVSREDILRLHATGDCFVCPSYGEAWCAPAFDAMAMSNVVISSNTGGPKDYIDNGVNGLLVDGSMEPVFGEAGGLSGFGTARELEFDISISDLQKKMRHVYNNHSGFDMLKENARLTAERYDYQNVGARMKELLNV